MELQVMSEGGSERYDGRNVGKWQGTKRNWDKRKWHVVASEYKEAKRRGMHEWLKQGKERRKKEVKIKSKHCDKEWETGELKNMEKLMK